MSRHARNALSFVCALAIGGSACGKRDAEQAAEVTPIAKESPAPASTTPSTNTEGDGEAGEDQTAQAAPPLTEKKANAHGAMGVSGSGVGGRAPYKKSRGMPAPKDAPDAEPAPQHGEDYTKYEANKMTLTDEDALSTFAVDVDTASYAIVRRKIMAGQAVPEAAVRVEEFLNYFRYSYEGPGDDRPFSVHMEAAPSPYTRGRHILRVGVQGKEVGKASRKSAHLVFLVDVSGSMAPADRLALAKQSLRILVDNLNENDTVALVTYAGNTRVVLEPTTMAEKARIHEAIEELGAGGSTAMASGIELAYQLARKQLSKDSVTRVIVLSDGDANVGNTTHEEILATIKGHVKEGVTLSTIGFGMGNYKDTMMEQLANKGNGNNYYIDSLSEAKKVFQEQLGGTLEVIAEDVKIQVDFDPKAVRAYRLVGYENRDIADRDFRNDAVDAGEIGAGHSVTAVYEVELAEKPAKTLATVRIRAKRPGGKEAAEHAYPFQADRLHASFADASADFRFATGVIGFAEILRKSPYADGWKVEQVLEIAKGATADGNAERAEFLTLVGKYARRS